MTAFRIALAMAGFGPGGVEQMALNLARGLVAAGHPVDIVVARNEGPRKDGVPEGARVIDLEAWHHPLSWRRLLRKKRHRVLAAAPPMARYFEAERPAVVLSAGTYINYASLRACARAAFRPALVVSYRNHFSRHSAGKPLARWIGRRACAAADAIVAVSDGVADDLAASAGLPRERIVTIYNPSVTPEVIAASKQPAPHAWLRDGGPPVLVAAGRLSPQKDFPTLIRAFAQVRARRPVRLIILGEGPERPALEAQVARLGLGGEVALPGFTSNPHAWMARAGAFVLSSGWEGFPNVLAEALACGCPVVSTDCPSGPAEILEGGRHGRLVPVGDADAMAVAIAETLDDPGDAAARQARAAEFSTSAAVDRYLGLFRSMEKIGEGGPTPSREFDTAGADDAASVVTDGRAHQPRGNS